MEFILKGEIAHSSWAGSQTTKREFRGSTLKEALDKIYQNAKYSNFEKRNNLSVLARSVKQNQDKIVWFEEGYGSSGSIKEIIVIKDNGEKVRIFEYEKYVSPKCHKELLEYEKYLDTLVDKTPNGEY